MVTAKMVTFPLTWRQRDECTCVVFFVSLHKSALRCVGKRMHFVQLKVNTSEMCILYFSKGKQATSYELNWSEIL